MGSRLPAQRPISFFIRSARRHRPKNHIYISPSPRTSTPPLAGRRRHLVPRATLLSPAHLRPSFCVPCAGPRLPTTTRRPTCTAGVRSTSTAYLILPPPELAAGRQKWNDEHERRGEAGVGNRAAGLPDIFRATRQTRTTTTSCAATTDVSYWASDPHPRARLFSIPLSLCVCVGPRARAPPTRSLTFLFTVAPRSPCASQVSWRYE